MGLLITSSLQIYQGIFQWKKNSRVGYDLTELWVFGLTIFGPPCTTIRISVTTVSNMSLQLQHDALVSVSEMRTSHQLQRLCCQQTKHKYKQHKVHVISPTSLQYNTSYTVFSRTFLEVSLSGHLTFVGYSRSPSEAAILIIHAV